MNVTDGGNIEFYNHIDKETVFNPLNQVSIGANKPSGEWDRCIPAGKNMKWTISYPDLKDKAGDI